MSDSVDFLDLLSAPQALDRIVGWREQEPVLRDDFLARVHAWRSLLADSPGKKFALYISDSIEFACALFGAWQAGKTIYLSADTLPATCATLRRDVDGYLGEFDMQWAPLAPAENSNATGADGFHLLNPDFVGLVVHTSGSTGAAQAIPKFLRQISAEVATLERLFGDELGTADIVATVSHQHIYGLLFKVLWPLAAGRAIHARSFAYPEELVPVLATHDCALISSPAHLKRLPDIPAWKNAAERLHAIFSSGGPLPLNVALDAERLLGRTPIEVYGSSETGGIAWRQRHAQSDDGWTPMANVDWRTTGDGGVLEVRSAHLPDANWFRLGDRVLAANDNRFSLQGRADRIVKIEEKRISLDAIENRLLASSLVTDVRVLVLDGKRQRIAAFVVPSFEGRGQLDREGKLAFNQSMRDWLIHSVERIALPRLWRYPDVLPVNAQGKTTHAELIALLDETPAPPKMPRERLLEKEAQRAVFELTAPRNLFYFDGHFPGAPILPGVVQIDWAIAYGRKCFDLPPVFLGINALKFQQVIHPEQAVTLELVHEQSKSCVTFKLSSPAGQHGSGRILFGTPDV
ncbi:MAG: AMP-binding protein [Burkholderiales bacterium RIFCSPLOWO2_02_FULL_57_36]|nr:MAG: AMP-binding protein [Burkholderiales bacterium RIFCSPLOWO2_02_FULL_57_36]